MMDGKPHIYLIQPVRITWFFNGYNWFLDRSLPMVDVSTIVSVQINQHNQPPIDIQVLENHMFYDFPDFFELSALGMVEPIQNAPINIWGLDYELIRYLNSFADPAQGGLFSSLVDINPQDLSIFGLDDPRFEIKIEMEDGFIYHLRIGNNTEGGMGGEAYAMFEGLDGVWIARNIFLFPILELNPFRMIYNFLALIEIWNIDRIELQVEMGHFDILLLDHDFLPAASEWDNAQHVMRATVNNEEFYHRAIRRFYTAIVGLRRESVVETHAPTGEPIEWIRLHLTDGTIVQHEFFHYNAAFYGISTNGGDISYLISRHSVSELSRYMHMMQNNEGIFGTLRPTS